MKNFQCNGRTAIDRHHRRCAAGRFREATAAALADPGVDAVLAM